MNPWFHVTVLFTSHFSPCFLKAFDMGDVLPPLHSPYAALRRCSFPHSKSQESYGGFR